LLLPVSIIFKLENSHEYRPAYHAFTTLLMTGAAQVAEVIDVIGRFAADLRRLGPANFL
jgi:hypothetical protein